MVLGCPKAKIGQEVMDGQGCAAENVEKALLELLMGL